MFQTVPECSRIFQKVPEGSRRFQKVPELVDELDLAFNNVKPKDWYFVLD